MATQEAVPGTRMPTLARGVRARRPLRRHGRAVQHRDQARPDRCRSETVAPGAFARRGHRVIEPHGVTRRSTDPVLRLAHAGAPRRRTAPGLRLRRARPGADDLHGHAVDRRQPVTGIGDEPSAAAQLAELAERIGAHVLSPRSVDLDRRRAHPRGPRRGLTAVVPWTVNETADMRALIDAASTASSPTTPTGPRAVMDAEGPRAARLGSRRRSTSQAHRGGRRTGRRTPSPLRVRASTATSTRSSSTPA